MKKALLIGINYKNTQNELHGCINDIQQVQNVLMKEYKYTNFVVLTDDTTIKPTKNNIITALKTIISNSQSCQEIWIHYSGHGISVKDVNRDELDGLDEALVPLDYKNNGFIIDDELNNIISKSKCNTRVILDCCHSGSALDLYYNAKIVDDKIVKFCEKNNSLNTMKNNIFMISGCMDNQTSADSSDPLKNIPMGALTSTFLRILEKNNYKITVSNLILQLNQTLIKNGYTQRPIFSSNKDIDLNSLYIIPQNNTKNIEESHIFKEKDIMIEKNIIIEENITTEKKNRIMEKILYIYTHIYNFVYDKFYARFSSIKKL